MKLLQIEVWRWVTAAMWLCAAIACFCFTVIFRDVYHTNLLLAFVCFGAALGTPFRRGTLGALLSTVTLSGAYVIYWILNN